MRNQFVVISYGVTSWLACMITRGQKSSWAGRQPNLNSKIDWTSSECELPARDPTWPVWAVWPYLTHVLEFQGQKPLSRWIDDRTNKFRVAFIPRTAAPALAKWLNFRTNWRHRPTTIHKIFPILVPFCDELPSPTQRQEAKEKKKVILYCPCFFNLSISCHLPAWLNNGTHLDYTSLLVTRRLGINNADGFLESLECILANSPIIIALLYFYFYQRHHRADLILVCSCTWTRTHLYIYATIFGRAVS